MVNISSSSVIMPGWLRLILYGFLSLGVLGTSGDRNFRFYIDDFIVKPVARDLIDVFNCTVSQTPNRSFINCHIRVNRNIYELELDSMMDMILQNKHIRRVYNVHFNACTFLVTLHKTRLFGAIAKSITEVFNGNVTCPVIANFNYTVTNWTIESNLFPSYVPDSAFRVLTKFYSKKRHLLSFTLLARVGKVK